MLDYFQRAIVDPRIKRVVSAINATRANGILVRCFTLPGKPTPAMQPQRLLESNALAAWIDQLRPLSPLPNLHLHRRGRFEFEGVITDLLLASDTDRRSFLPIGTAKHWAADLIEALGGDKRFEAYRTTVRWAEWFQDVAADVTWVIRTDNPKVWWLICVTDAN